MKRVILAFVITAAIAAHADADSYIYWMVGSEPGYEYTSAILVAGEGSMWTWDADQNRLGSGALASDISDARGFGDGIYSALGSYSGSTYTYFVELLMDNKVVAYSTAGLSSADLAPYLSSLNKFDPGASSTPWTASSFAAAPIPEPTSGLMMLLGVAALALRRRRV